MHSLEGDREMDAGDTLLATASPPCQLGCAATTNKLLPSAKDNRATGTQPRTLLLAASGTRVRKDGLVFFFLHLSFLKEGGTSLPAASAEIQFLCNQM